MAGLINTQMQTAARQGRNGDTKLAHVTPGEMVVPREVAAMRPDLVAHIRKSISGMGGNPSKYTVGAGRVNPATGAEEFATEEEITEAYRSILGRDPDAGGMEYWKGRDNLNDFRGAAAPEIINKVYQDNFGRPADQGGAAYWAAQGANDPVNYDYSARISSGAQTQDAIARDDIAAGGVDTSTTWGNGASLSNPLKYDAVNNTWGTSTAADTVTGGTAAADTVTGGTAAADAVAAANTANTTAATNAATTAAAANTAATTNSANAAATAANTTAASVAAQTAYTAAGSAAPVTAVAAGTPLAATAKADTATAAANVVAGNAAASNYNAQQANASLQAPAETYTADKATAANWDVTAPQTVQSQIRDIIAADSPLMQQAATRGLQQANARGLVNSDMAIGASQGELYKAATPIAQQDASTYARSGEFNAANRQQTSLANQNAANTAGQWNAGARNLVSSQNSQLQTNVNLTNAAQTNQALQFNAATATDVSKTNVANALQAGIVNQAQANEISKFNANLLTTVDLANTRDANLFQQFALDQAFKAGVVNQEQYNAMSKFNADAENTFTTAANLAGANAASAANLAGTNAASAANLAGTNTATAANLAGTNAASAANLAGTNTATAANLAGTNTATAANLAGTNAAAATAANTQAVLMSKINADSQIKINAASDATKAVAVGISNANDNLIKTNALAASSFNQALGAISAIEVNAGMDATTKTQAIAGVWRDVAAQMDVLGGVAGLNLGVRNQLRNYPGFDASGNWVGFPATAATGGGLRRGLRGRGDEDVDDTPFGTTEGGLISSRGEGMWFAGG